VSDRMSLIHTIEKLNSSIRILPSKGLDVCKWGTQHLRKNGADRPMGGQGGLFPNRWAQGPARRGRRPSAPAPHGAGAATVTA